MKNKNKNKMGKIAPYLHPRTKCSCVGGRPYNGPQRYHIKYIYL